MERDIRKRMVLNLIETDGKKNHFESNYEASLVLNMN